MSNVAAKKAAEQLKAEQVTQRQCEERISSIERDLKNATGKCQALEEENKAKVVELERVLREAREAQSKSRVAREEIRQDGEIEAAKLFLL